MEAPYNNSYTAPPDVPSPETSPAPKVPIPLHTLVIIAICIAAFLGMTAYLLIQFKDVLFLMPSPTVPAEEAYILLAGEALAEENEAIKETLCEMISAGCDERTVTAIPENTGEFARGAVSGIPGVEDVTLEDMKNIKDIQVKTVVEPFNFYAVKKDGIWEIIHRQYVSEITDPNSADKGFISCQEAESYNLPKSWYSKCWDPDKSELRVP